MPTMIEAMLEAAKRGNLAFSSTAESDSSTSQLVDAALADTASGPASYAGAWVYRLDATAAGDRLRRLPTEGASYNTSARALLPERTWTNAPDGETYHCYSLIPPRATPGQTTSWAELTNRALRNLRTVTAMPVGVGNGRSRHFRARPQVVTLLAGIAVAGGSGATVTTPTGWTLVSSVDLSTTLKLVLYRRRALLTDPIEWEVSFDQARVATGFIAAYLDTNPSSPVDASGSATGAAAASITAPSVTTTQDNERVVRIAAAASALAFARPDDPDLALGFDAVVDDGAHPYGIILADQVVTQAGAAGTAVLTPSASGDLIALTVALAPREEARTARLAGYSLASTVAAGASSITLRRPLNLPTDDWTPDRESIRRVWLQRYDDLELEGGAPARIDMQSQGRWWRFHEDGVLELGVTPQAGWDVWVEVQRPYPVLVADNDETDCDLDRLALRALVEAYQALNAATTTRGRYQSELAQALATWEAVEREHRPTAVVVLP